MKGTKRAVITLAALLVFAIAGLIGVSYAYWSRLTAERENTVIIGEGTEVVVEVTAEPPVGKKLVPAGNDIGTDDVDHVELIYRVRLSQETKEDLILSVTASDVRIGENTQNAELVNIEITHPAHVNEGDVETRVKVTLLEPSDEQQYEAARNKVITFKLTFSATVPEEG